MSTVKLALFAAISITLLPGLVFAQPPDPALCTVPQVIISPDGSLDYVVKVQNALGPMPGVTVRIEVSPAADALVCWCAGQAHPQITAMTDTSGEATFNIGGGGCIDPAVLGSPPVDVYGDMTLLAQVGIVSPDALHSNKLPTDPGAQPCSPCRTDLADVIFHTTSLVYVTGYCTDINSDGSVGLLDAVLMSGSIIGGTECPGQVSCPLPTGGNTDARIALHATGVISKKGFCTAINNVAYSDFITQVPTNLPVNLFVVVARATTSVAGVSFGIEYNPANLLISDFSRCADLMFQTSGWPASGSGARITWEPTNRCQTTVVGSDGIHAVAGAFYAYAYAQATFSLTQNLGTQTPEARVADCNFLENDVTSCLGKTGFGFDGTDPDRPILPNACDAPDSDTTGVGWIFNNVPGRRWCDPPTVFGYEYEMISGSLFTKVVNFPAGFDDPFTVSVEGIVLGTGYANGDSVEFSDHAAALGSLLVGGVGVESFQITEISPYVEEDDPLAFPLQLDFDTPTADFKMTPLKDPAILAVTKPSGLPSPLRASNFPNPFQSTTWIQYVIPEASPVTVEVFDSQGRRVRTLVADVHKEAGEHVVRWDGRDEAGQTLAAGVFFYRVTAGSNTVSRKLILSE